MVIPDFAGMNLPPGEHSATWEEFVERFGKTPYRMGLIEGLQRAIGHLRDFGCRRVFIGGSFVTRKEKPKDFDFCWDPTGVDTARLKFNHPVVFNFAMERLAQKAIYKGEFFPCIAPCVA